MLIQKIKNNRGFVILFAVTISSILLAIALGVGNITFKEISFATEAKDTNYAFFAADTGVECALFNNKSSSNSFVNRGGSGSVTCLGGIIAITETPPSFWSFVVSELNGIQGCAKVTIDKTDSSATTIISKGYNNGDSSCNSSSPNRVERELRVIY